MKPSGSKRTISLVVRALFILLAIDAILFGAAGRMDWQAAWVFTLLFFLFLMAVVVWSIRDANVAELMEERNNASKRNVKSWDRVILPVYLCLLLAILVVAGLDAGRFRWSTVPPLLQALGMAGFVAGAGMVAWCVSANAYLSSYARIQEDRGHQVAQTGPYQFVRHPMYAAIILLVICLALLLGSWWAVVPAGLIGPLFVLRTALEDRMLRRELAGYDEYAHRVRFRLIPGVW